jgi:predicted ribosome quality control (RQC) complex YloA/Tae2 family protein
MPFDALTISSVRREIEQKAVGGRVQGVLAAAPLTVGLEIYKAGAGRTFLLLSAHPQNARVHFTPTAPSRDPQQQPPLLLLLRKYVRGGIITRISQPPYERVLVFSIAKRLGPGKHQEYHSDPYFMDNTGDEDYEGPEAADSPDAPLTTVDLVIEIMGRLSNIVLVEEDGTVMDSIKRIPAGINRYRVTLPHHPYVPPPPQDKRDPLRSSLGVLSLALQKVIEQEQNAPAWKGLVSGFKAVSPALAREVVFRALGDVAAPAADLAVQPALLERVENELRALLSLDQSGVWEPTVAWEPLPGGGHKALDFAPYALTHLAARGAEIDRYASISEAASEYYAAIVSVTGHSAIVSQARAELGEMRSRDERRVAALREQLERAESADELRRKGEFLLAYMHTLAPGQTRLVIPEEKLIIDLDPWLSPVENAQTFFKEYHKARSAQEGLPALLEQAEMQVKYLDELETSLDLAAGYDDIRAVQAEIKLARSPGGHAADREGSGQAPKQQRKPRGGQEKLPQPLKLKTRSGIQLLVGRTARQNDAATFRLAGPDDLWFHARGVPGSHVILRTAGAEASQEDIEEAAAYAAGRSRAREQSQVDVIYAPRRHVRKVPNSPPGFVTVRNEQVVRVRPRREA